MGSYLRAGAHSLFGLSGSALIRRWVVNHINMVNCQEGFLECKRI